MVWFVAVQPPTQAGDRAYTFVCNNINAHMCASEAADRNDRCVSLYTTCVRIAHQTYQIYISVYQNAYKSTKIKIHLNCLHMKIHFPMLAAKKNCPKKKRFLSLSLCRAYTK